MLNWNINLEHIYFGLMRFKETVFSTRKGNVIKLEDLFNEAVKRALAIVEEKNPDLPDEEKANIAEVIGIGAVKYADLSQNRVSTVIFEWEKALSLEGNTAPYLQYVYARIKSVKRKADEKNITLDIGSELNLESDIERNLATGVLNFPSTILKAAESHRPNLIADYLFELAQKFNSFYNSMPILKENDDVLKSRLLLSLKVAETIKTGLDLLGIKVVERM